MQRCPRCGTPNRDSARFCGGCGGPLPLPLVAGDLLRGRYLISRLLGAGGMGAVYQAQDTRLGHRSVAVKENFDASAEAQAQFKLEATTLAALNHPNLPRVLDHFIEPSGKQYLVLDFVEGEDLQAMLDQHGPIPEMQARTWIEAVCDALAYLHSRNPPIVHGDIKPANIKITPAGRAVLVALDVAALDRPGQKTAAAALAVTSGFSAPEQYGGLRAGERSDIYALAATLYCLLTGQAPPDALERLTGTRLIPPRYLNPAISLAAEAAIERGLALNPQDRWQTVSEIQALLRPAALRSSAPPPSATDTGQTGAAPAPPIPASQGHPMPQVQLKKLRLDVGVPDRVAVQRPFDLAVTVRHPESPVLAEADLRQIGSAPFWVRFRAARPWVRLRIVIDAPECEIAGEESRSFTLWFGKDSPVFYWHLIPRHLGDISVIVTVFEVKDWLGSARVHTEVVAQASGTVKMVVHAEPLVHDPVASIEYQLREHHNNLLLIEERKAQYVEETGIPIQLVKDERRTRKQIAELQERLADARRRQ